MTHKSIIRFALLVACSSLCAALISCKILSPEKKRHPEKTPPKIAASLDGKLIRLEIIEEPFALRILDHAGKILMATSGPIQFTTVRDQKAAYRVSWFFISDGKPDPWTFADHVVSAKETDGVVEAYIGSEKNGAASIKLTAKFLDERSLEVNVAVIDRPSVNRMSMKFFSDADDRYFGMGERMNSPEHRGSVVRNWCAEGAMGIYDVSKIAPNLSFNPFPLGQDTTYFPVPFFLNTKGYGFLIDDTHYSAWDFAKSDKNTLAVENWNNRFDFKFFYGPSPLDVIEAMTAQTGRVTPPQPWVFAPWNVAIGGSKVSREVAATVRRERIPTSAIWSEDWWWDETTPKWPRSKEWALNTNRYPDYEKMIDEMHKDGFRYLGYFKPYVFSNSELYKEGAAKGYFIKDKNGAPLVLQITFAEQAQLDVTNPAAVQWWQDKLYRRNIDWGIDGWMTDFGEYVPPDSRLADGRDGWAVHNEYPLLWAKMTRELFDRARPDGDYTFFVRAGYTGSQKYAPVMWTGDSNANWEKYDGLPSAISAALSVGISGFPITATDIAGYHCIMSPSTDKELFIRWAQFGAMLPVMRNHKGVDFCKNWEFDSDRETLDAYKKAAVMHTALFPYIYTLVHDAAKRGWPVVRHLALHYPDDPGSRAEHYEFLLGDRLLAAPVIIKGAREKEVYFPPGEWIDFYTGEKFSGPGRKTVAAPLDKIPLFVKSGALLPSFDSVIDTLVKEDRSDLNGWDDANASMKIVFYGEGRDEYTLWDGTKIKCGKSASSEGECSVEGAAAERKYTFEFK